MNATERHAVVNHERQQEEIPQVMARALSISSAQAVRNESGQSGSHHALRGLEWIADRIGVVDVRQQKLIFTYGRGAFELAR